VGQRDLVGILGESLLDELEDSVGGDGHGGVLTVRAVKRRGQPR
jgi:hypothetical protein